MPTLRKITKARTSQELERMIEDEKERGWNVASRLNYISAVNSDSQLYKQAGNGVTANVIELIAQKLV